MKARSKNRLWLAAGVVVALLGGYYFHTHRFQVYVVRTRPKQPGVNTFAPVYDRSASVWFSNKAAAMDFASQQGGQGFVVAIVADRSDGILEGFHDHFLTGEALDAIIARVEASGSKLWRGEVA